MVGSAFVDACAEVNKQQAAAVFKVHKQSRAADPQELILQALAAYCSCMISTAALSAEDGLGHYYADFDDASESCCPYFWYSKSRP